NDSARFEQFSTQIPGVLFDYSKQLIDSSVMAELHTLAQACDIPLWRDKMFSGEKINITEDRAVLHTALRNRKSSSLVVDGENVSSV
ncbi:glucose-6-phosphate isomerase, partial [Streptomyces scabiei]